MATAEMRRSNEVDSIVRSLVPDVPGTALIAVGGYGREDLFPHSDVDLLILAEPAQAAAFTPFLRLLWDHGLRVSQSAHTIGECLSITEGNLEFTLSLIDRRFLAGDRALWTQLDQGFRRFFARKRDDIAMGAARLTRDRHDAYQNTIYHLEPNVKDGPGGLRHIHVLTWFNALGHLEEPAAKLAALRNGLHVFYGRDTNVLNFEAQDAIGPSPDEVMAQYFRAARKVQRAINAWRESEESRSTSLFARLRDRSSSFSTAELSVIHGKIYLSDTHPPDNLNAYTLVARHGVRLSSEAGRRMHQALVQDRSMGTLCQWSELEQILLLPHAALALREMHDTGVLGRIFPSWARIEGLVVRDFYHQYTVDEHTLVAIETVLRLRTEAPGLFSSLARGTGNYPLLLVALLLHDTGKGRGYESHAEASVRSAAPELERMGMPREAREEVLFLIGAHLEMSRIMTTRDLTDPDTALSVSRLTGSEERLALLTLMTYGDISAVNPRALTPWRTTLLWQLYSVTAKLPGQIVAPAPMMPGVTLEHALEHGGGVWRLAVSAPDRPFLFASVAGAISSFGMDIVHAEAFTTEGDHTACERFTFTDPFLTLKLNPEEAETLTATVERAAMGKEDVAKLLQRRVRKPQPSAAFTVNFDREASRSATVVTITTEDRPALLYRLAEAISSEGCNIETVLINTEGRKAVDVFYVTASGLKLTAGKEEQLSARIRSAS